METKIIYFVVSGKEEQAEFSDDALSEDIKGKSLNHRSLTYILYVISYYKHAKSPEILIQFQNFWWVALVALFIYFHFIFCCISLIWRHAPQKFFNKSLDPHIDYRRLDIITRFVGFPTTGLATLLLQAFHHNLK